MKPPKTETMKQSAPNQRSAIIFMATPTTSFQILCSSFFTGEAVAFAAARPSLLTLGTIRT